MRIGYVPYRRDLMAPADRRRFPYWAERRGVEFELADLEEAYDLVVVTPRADLLRWSRYRPGACRLVFDIVDSYLDIPRSNPKALLRGPAKFLAREARSPFFNYRKALERIMQRADAVTCATPEQAAAIQPFCSNVHPVLDAQTRMITRVKEDYGIGSPVKLVWEGLGENVRWFEEVRAPLTALNRQTPLQLHLVTATRFKQVSQRFWTRDTAKIAARCFDAVEVHEWTEAGVSQVATACDLALIPLPLHRPLETGKPESKLISFWRMGMPTVASATPAYARVMQAAGQDLCCSSDEEWITVLTRLAGDREARESAGRGGRAYAEREYSDDRLLAVWDAALGMST